MKNSHLVKLALLICLLFSVSSLAAPVGESAGEIWLDGPEDKQPGINPAHPDAAVDHRGSSIFVWDGNPAINGGNDIWLRIFDSGRIPPGDPVRVNSLLEYHQDYPRVAVSSDGSFLVIWQSNEPFEPGDGLRRVVRSQAFDTNAQPVGTEQRLNTLRTNGTTTIRADVAALRDGGYVVAWQSGNTYGDDANTSIQARKIDALGEPVAEQFQVNSITGNDQRGGAVTELADGGFMIVWRIPELRGRRFDADGTPVGEGFQINTLTVGGEFEPDAVLHEDGRVLVVWKDDEEAGDNWEIRGRLYSQSLVAQGDDFRINTLISGAQENPRVAAYAEGGFFVVWDSAVSAGDDNDPTSIEGRIVTGRDQFAGPQFQLNEWIEGNQIFPGIGGKNGRIAVAWDSRSGPDTPDSAILGQFWNICGIFCDGFE
jgi:hypothetical protein